jgi:signal transduction histidine kinase
MRARSLTRSLVLGAVLAFGLSALACTLVFYALIHGNSTLVVRDGLMGQAEEVAEAIRLHPDGSLQVQMHEPMKWGYDAFYENLKFRVLTPEGRVLASSEADQRRLGSAPLPVAQPVFETLRTGPDLQLHVATAPFEVAGRRLLIQTARSDRFAELGREAVEPAVYQAAMVVGAVCIVVFAIVVSLAIRASLRPLASISQAAAQLNGRNLSERLPLAQAPREVQPLVAAVNEALARIEHSARVLERFVANAAHELKTPLATLRGRLESQPQPGSAVLLDDVNRMARLVSQMLQLAEASEPTPLRRSPIDVQSVVLEVMRLLEPLAARQDVDLVCQVAAGRRWVGDPGALFVILRNLVENALHYGGSGTTVLVAETPDGLRVDDEGPGVAASSLPHLFERFWRGSQSGPAGAGLGLAIVAELADKQGWRVVAANRTDRSGLRMRLVVGD